MIWRSTSKLCTTEVHPCATAGASWTARRGPICRRTVNQRICFSGHKRQHSVKYQSVMCANGIVCQLDGPYAGHKHDASILRLSGLYQKLEKLSQSYSYGIYGLRGETRKNYSGKPTHQTRTPGEAASHNQPVNPHQGPDHDASPGWEPGDYIAWGQSIEADPGPGAGRDPPIGEGRPKRQ
ncbi:hypothetical protein MRX96_009372 [Rhipicephalus microplus]